MQIIGERLRALRESVKLSQAKLAELLGTSQVSVNRYENNTNAPPLKTLLWYADYFDVSLDYIFGRTDKPEGTTYEYKPKIFGSVEMNKFIEMCFDPKSPMSERLKSTLFQLFSDSKE